MRRRIAGTVAVCCMVLLPGFALAQSVTMGTIAGLVRDTSGAVLPGVTVEATSPALLEKVRVATTDAQGQYKIVELRPGRYSVTFTLPGFTTVRREGLELTTGFTAIVNADLQVGALAETITVSGASPVVDTQNTNQQKVIGREILDSVPTNNSAQGFQAIIPGATQSAGAQTSVDLGGSLGDTSIAFAVHGGRFQDLRTYMNGMGVATMMGAGGGTSRFYTFNQVAADEITLQTGAASAEGETGGVLINMVPKAGGNTFGGIFQAAFANGDMQGTNLTQELKARGLVAAPKIATIYEAKAGFGGPIVRDKLWFYISFGRWEGGQEIPGNYFNKLAGTHISPTAVTFFEPDLSRPAIDAYPTKEQGIRVTWQASAKHKIAAHYSNENNTAHPGLFSGAGNVRGEAAIDLVFNPNYVVQGNWTFPATSRLLFEAGAEYVGNALNTSGTSSTAGIGKDRPIIDLADGFMYGSRWSRGAALGLTDYSYAPANTSHNETRVTVSYVTGSHAVKVGMTTLNGVHTQSFASPYAEVYTFRNRVPVQITQLATPFHTEATLNLKLGLFAQDQWTIRGLTLNLGGRLAYMRTSLPAQETPSGVYNPGFSFPAVDTVLNWKDFEPRLGAAYDLFGNGKTAIKGTFGRYGIAESLGFTTTVAGPSRLINTATRTWNDSFYPAGDPRRENYVPDCDLRSATANGECGALSNAAFGTLSGAQTRYAPSLLQGWHVRPFNWQSSLSIQQELRPGVALAAGYYRTWYGNFRVTNNAALRPTDFSPYCITVPTDSRIPGGGGQQLCGLYDLNPSRFGVPADNVVMPASDFGKQSEVSHSVDFTVNARFGKGGILSGGLSATRTTMDACAIAMNHPEVTATLTDGTGASYGTGASTSTEFCRITAPFRGQAQVKLSGYYPLPWATQISGTIQSVPGPPVQANHVVTNAQILPSLGRNLGQCGSAATCNGTVTVSNLFDPRDSFEGRRHQVDVRLTKFLQLGRLRVRGNFDVYNLFNRSSIIGVTTRYSATNSWLQPTGILGARLFKFGTQLDF